MIREKKVIWLSVCLLLIGTAAVGFFLMNRETTENSNNIVQKEGVEESVVPEQPTVVLEEMNILAQLPTTETLLAMEKISEETWIAVSTPGPTEVDERGNTYAQAKIWFASKDVPIKLLKSKTLKGQYVGSVGFVWDHNYYRGRQYLDYLTVQLYVAGEGPFSWMEIASDYIDVRNEKIIVSASWISSFGSSMSIEIDNQPINFGFKMQNHCNERIDGYPVASVTALIVNSEEVQFKESMLVQCEIYGEGDPMPVFIGFYEPPQFLGKRVTFNLPWGVPVEIELDKVQNQKTPLAGLHSKEFIEEYPFNDD